VQNLKISDVYTRLTNQNEKLQMEDILRKVCNEAGLNNVTYLGLQNNQQSDSEAKIFSTYDPGWVARYEEQRYHLIDPVVAEGVNSFLPVDWSKLPKKDKLVRDFFGEASEWGVCENGISIPIRDPSQGRAILSVNTEMSTREWNKYQREFIADFTYLANLIHNDVVKNDVNTPKVSLTPREAEMLKWAAIGKTSWETSQITGLSERTVNFYLTNASQKLHASNKVAAVAKALRDGHIMI
jgi:DNA-binding CsgD family transcriptional regulator